MVTLAKDWNGPNQAAFSSGSNQVTQYQERVWALKEALVDAGWTVERSCDSSAVSASDNWTTAANVVHGTEASQAHSWICLAAPMGKGNPSGGSEYRLQLNCNVSSASSTPQALDIRLARGTYGGGSTTTRASITGTELSVLAHNIIPWSGAVAGSLCTWFTDDGDVYWAVKADGDSFFRAFGFVRSDDVDSLGSYCATLAGWSNASSDVVTSNNLTTATNQRGFTAAGSALTTIACDAMAWSGTICSNWASGSEGSSGRIFQQDVICGSNAGTRFLGILVDIRAVPPNAAWMRGDLNDDGNALPFELLTIGDVMIPCDGEIT